LGRGVESAEVKKHGDIVVLASGECPFCHEPIHIVCDVDKVSESAKIVDGRVIHAYPGP
jgi:hypothetical protein